MQSAGVFFLEEVGLKGYENRSFSACPEEKNKGCSWQERLAQESRLILLDEPTNHLDIPVSISVDGDLKETGCDDFFFRS